MRRLLLILLLASPCFGAITHVSGGCSAAAAASTAIGNSWTFSCTPNAANDAVVLYSTCSPASGTVTGATLTASGWTITQLVAPVGNSTEGWGAEWGAITPNTSATTFTVTFSGVTDCNNWHNHIHEEFAGTDLTGGTTTFNATGSSQNTSGGCNQAGANVTPPNANEVVWFACEDSATAVTSPYSAGANDSNQDIAEYQILSGGAGVAKTPAFTTSGGYVVMGVAINPPSTVGPNVGFKGKVGFVGKIGIK